MSIKALLSKAESNDLDIVKNALVSLTSLSKRVDDAENLFNENGFDRIYNLGKEENGNITALAFSVMANCANLSSKWRRKFFEESKMEELASILNKNDDVNVVSRVVRLMANLAKDCGCLSALQDKFIISLLVKYAASGERKCEVSCLRALRIICSTAKSAKIAAECELFRNVILLLNSQDNEVVVLCLRMICELLKTQAVEVCYHCIDAEVLSRLIPLSNSESSMEDIILEILFMLTLNNGCRVAVAMEGAIEVFLRRIKTMDQSESFKFSTQGLCLCAREAVSRNRMKVVGALPALVEVLHKKDFVQYHESIVAAFVWFLFDDSSLALLIRADISPALLLYLQKLTLTEYNRSMDILKQELFLAEQTDENDEERSLSTSQIEEECKVLEEQSQHDVVPTTSVECVSMDYSNHWSYSSPETSPYNAYSPQYSIPSFSPHMSPNYSPPTSPESSLNIEYDTYSDNSIESSFSSKTPYQFQSADGIHAMIHGTRGPIHDILLLLSRFSQANDPSSIFLFLPGFNSLLDYLLLSYKPNPKCARILNRLTLNSHCFDPMIKRKLVPRLYLRLFTGWSLEYLTKLLDDARNQFKQTGKCDEVSRIDNLNIAAHPTNVLSKKDENIAAHPSNVLSTKDEIIAAHPSNVLSTKDENIKEGQSTEKDFEAFDVVKHPSSTTFSLGQLLLSNIRSQCETSYGKGVLSHIFLTGSKQLKEVCVLSLPHIVWSLRLQKRMFFELKALQTLLNLVQFGLSNDSETFILTVEAVCALSRLLVLKVSHFDDALTVVKSGKNSGQKNEDEKRKERIRLKLPSGKCISCSVSQLASHSIVFERMLSHDYIDTKKEFVTINDVNESAFVCLLHYMHGCEVDISTTTCCAASCVLSETYRLTKTKRQSSSMEDEEAGATKRKKLDHDNDAEISYTKTEEATDEPLTNDNRTNCVVENVMQLFICCERFFVDALKLSCEKNLVSMLSCENITELILLSFAYHSELLENNSLIYLLTSVQCPMLRSRSFSEILFSHEKEVFLSSLQRVLEDGLKKKF